MSPPTRLRLWQGGEDTQSGVEERLRPDPAEAGREDSG